MMQLTPKQRRVFDFIRDTLKRTGAPPTRAEIADALGFASANAAQAHLQTLARKGVIELGSRRSRGIRLVDTADDGDEPAEAGETLAVIGRVAAGAPILAVENVERRVSIAPGLFSAPADYLLTVRGNSMTGAGILDGDLLGVKTGAEIRDGQIGVFRIDDEVTVKRFKRDRDRVWLQAENPAYADIEVDPARDTFALEGLAVGIVRSSV
ncbi:transcriptional repressor LexA [Salinisphaera sp.]|uniref:transcriptional repressor LexA n=1 Tax=Salinisphaera sp. TaxID=1914330 RepID=UPI002D77D0CD|nr:transcriptional repressor LexA [Salinisphaera sp.]HET7315597.1 transcriptional repressor LexA [Salinisphaera sp.]